MGRIAINLTGMIFGELMVLKRDPSINKNAKWICLCSCGNETITESLKLRNGKSKSCGCKRHEYIGNANKTHGMTNTRIYSIWHSMIGRCKYPSTQYYNRYGGRGIKVCEEWSSFDSFYKDMGPSYEKGLTIDRIDSNGNYELSNCRWADLDTQNNNRESNVLITIDGETKTMKHWSDVSGVNYQTVRSRVKVGKKGIELLKRV